MLHSDTIWKDVLEVKSIKMCPKNITCRPAGRSATDKRGMNFMKRVQVLAFSVGCSLIEHNWGLSVGCSLIEHNWGLSKGCSFIEENEGFCNGCTFTGLMLYSFE